MASRLLLAAIVGIAVAVALTRLVISYDYIRIWLINVPSLLVWGGAFLTGIVVAAIAPPTFEVSTPAVTMFAGSLIGIIAFGTGMNVSLADQTVLTYILLTLMVSGLSLLVLSALGGWLVAAVRNYQESNYPYSIPGSRRRSRKNHGNRNYGNRTYGDRRAGDRYGDY